MPKHISEILFGPIAHRGCCEFEVCSCSTYFGPHPYGRCFICSHGAVWHKFKNLNKTKRRRPTPSIIMNNLNCVINIPSFCDNINNLPA